MSVKGLILEKYCFAQIKVDGITSAKAFPNVDLTLCFPSGFLLLEQFLLAFLTSPESAGAGVRSSSVIWCDVWSRRHEGKEQGSREAAVLPHVTCGAG